MTSSRRARIVRRLAAKGRRRRSRKPITGGGPYSPRSIIDYGPPPASAPSAALIQMLAHAAPVRWPGVIDMLNA